MTYSKIVQLLTLSKSTYHVLVIWLGIYHGIILPYSHNTTSAGIMIPILLTCNSRVREIKSPVQSYTAS